LLVIDRDPERPRTSRAIGTQLRTVEVFRLMGIPESALQPAARPRALHFAEGERTLARIAFDGSAPDAPRLISMDESDTERVLEERLAHLGGRVERGVELIGFRVEGDRVVAILRSSAGDVEVEARFLVGADGAHSTVRRDAGISFVGSNYPERFLLADLDLGWGLPHDEGTIWIGDDGLAAVIPLPGERRYRVIVPLPPDESTIEYASEAEMADRAEALLRQRAQLPLRRVGEPLWASAFHIQRRQAERYRQGPIFLAGDAAHVHSPVGGQGMNTGIQDAFNLGWKLALATQDLAAPGLLDTYHAERHPIAQGVLRGTDLGTRLVLARNPVVRGLREWVAPIVTHLGPVRHRLLRVLAQLSVAYRDSPLSIDAASWEDGGLFRRGHGGLQIGDRVPDAALRSDPGGDTISLFDLISAGWTLLLFPGEPVTAERQTQLDALAQQVRETVGDRVHGHLVLIAPRADFGAALIDAQGEVTRRFGARAGLVALIRPDGYLGFRGRLDQPGELASYLARVFAMRLRGLADDEIA
jgi:2-polyprenyl-6-methoxyphenol hydroxylase-like FAD-dependent oxidoreductase